LLHLLEHDTDRFVAVHVCIDQIRLAEMGRAAIGSTRCFLWKLDTGQFRAIKQSKIGPAQQ